MATTTRTVQDQAKELLTTCADVIKNGGWICGAIHETLYTDAPRNQKPPGCAVGLLGMWGDLLPITVEKDETDPGMWMISTTDTNPSEWNLRSKNYKVGVEALYALARAASEIYKSEEDDRWKVWDEEDGVEATETYVIDFNDGDTSPRSAEDWFRSAIHLVR